MLLAEIEQPDNILIMTSNADAAVETLFNWDNLFADYNTGLKPPIDVLPTVSDEEEQRLLNDAQIVFRAFKLRDTAYLDALTSPDPQLQTIANTTKLGHEAFVRTLLQKISDARAKVQGQHETLDAIQNKYQQADQQFYAEQANAKEALPTDQRVKNRIATCTGGVQIGTDVDKTLTQHAEYLQMIPGSVQAENYMAHENHGRETFPLVFSQYWREAMKTLAANFYLIGKNVPFRPGVEEFFQQTEQVGIPVSILSASFRPLINGVMSHIHANNIQRTFAIEENDIGATDKNTILQELAAEQPDRALIYIGDGDSDFPAAESDASRVIALYFALEGGSFAKKLVGKNLPHYTFKSFEDVNAVLARLGILAK